MSSSACKEMNSNEIIVNLAVTKQKSMLYFDHTYKHEYGGACPAKIFRRAQLNLLSQIGFKGKYKNWSQYVWVDTT